MNEQHTVWDDLRFVLAVGRSGSFSQAAVSLGLSHPTVFRRIGELERRLGVRLFERSRTGCAPTPAGEELVAVAARMEDEVRRAERRLAGQDLRPAGTVRLTTTDTLLTGLLSSLFSRFRSRYPEIVLEIIVSNEVVNLSRRDADVAIRPSRDVADTLVGRRVSQIAMAVYGHRSVVGETGAAEALDGPWIGLDASLSYHPVAHWLAEGGRATQVAYRVNSLLGCCDGVRARIGVAVLPCFLGDRDPELERIGQPLHGLASELWLLTHPDLQKVTRIRAVLDFMAAELRPCKDLLEGRSPVS